MDIEGQAYRLVGLLPVLGVMTVGVWLAYQHRWRNPRVCTLVGIALLLAMGVYVVLPVVLQVAMNFFINQVDDFDVGGQRWRLISLAHTFIYASASAVVWGLVLFAIFGPDGVTRAQRGFDDDYESPRIKT